VAQEVLPRINKVAMGDKVVTIPAHMEILRATKLAVGALRIAQLGALTFTGEPWEREVSMDWFAGHVPPAL
jgi:hypothetical protein